MDDPVAHASTKVMSWASLVATAAEAWAQIAAMRSRARAARSEEQVRRSRVERETALARDRLWWKPMLRPDEFQRSSVRDAGLAWTSAQAWRGFPEAEHVVRLAEARLRDLRPDVMRVYDAHVVGGMDPVTAMAQVSDLMDRPPAHPAPVERLEFLVPRSAADVAAETFPPEVSDTAERAVLLRAQEDAQQLFVSARVLGAWVPGYLADRGLSDAARSWGVGYAPAGWTVLVDHMRGLGYSDDVLVAAGLASPSKRGGVVDRFRDRLMVPVRNQSGETVGFVGRKSPGNESQRDPKYLNSPETMLYRKGEHLMGVWEARDALARGGRPVVVEGAFDAMAVTQVSDGAYVGVAPSGTALTDAQVDVLKQSCDADSRGVTVCFDGDEAGRQAALRAADVLHRAGLDSPQVALLPDGEDPAGMVSSATAIELMVVLEGAQPLADMVVDARLAEWPHGLEHIEHRVRAAGFVASTVAELPTVDVDRQIIRLAVRAAIPRSQPLKAAYVPKAMEAHREWDLVR